MADAGGTFGSPAHNVLDILSESLEKWPKLKNVITILKRQLSQDKELVKLESTLKEAQNELRTVKHKYLISWFLVQELKTIAYNGSGDDVSSELQEKLRKTLIIAELLHYNHRESSSGKLMGMTDDLLRQGLKKFNKSEQQELKRQIYEGFKKRAQKLVSAYEYCSPSASGCKDFSQVATFLEMDKHNYEAVKLELQNLQESCHKQMQKYEKALTDALAVLWDLIENYRLKGPTDSNEQLASLLAMKVEALTLKLKVIQLEFLQETYSPEATKALKNIRHSIDNELEESQKKIMATQIALRSYEELGSKFNSLVSEYRKLQKGIDEKKWAISKLEEKP